MLAVNLSIRLDVLALVSLYLTNKLISHKPLFYRKVIFMIPYFDEREIPHITSLGISGRFQPLFPSKRYVTYVLLTLSPLSDSCLSLRSTCMPHPRRQHSI